METVWIRLPAMCQVVMAKVFESMKEATGIDLADIINAESYDAQVTATSMCRDWIP